MNVINNSVGCFTNLNFFQRTNALAYFIPPSVANNSFFALIVSNVPSTIVKAVSLSKILDLAEKNFCLEFQ